MRVFSCCESAFFELRFGNYVGVRYRRIKDILNAALDQQPLPVSVAPPPPPAVFAFERSAAEFFDAEVERCRATRCCPSCVG